MARNRRLEIALAVLVVVAAAFYARLAYIPQSPEFQLQAAADKYDLELGEPNRWFSAWSLGDGQAFAVIAADPTGKKLSVEVKEPAYRFTRAFYGWVASAASLGREPWVPYGLALVGALALLGTVALAVSLRSTLGTRAWLLVLNPAIYLGFGGDTAEPLGLLLLAYALASGSIWAAAALGVTRPSYLVAVFGRWRLLAAGGISLAALLVYALAVFGSQQFIPAGGRLAAPLVAYIRQPSIVGWLIAIFALATLIVGVRRRDWGWVASAILVLCLGSDVLADSINVWRAAGMLPVLWAFGPGYTPARDVMAKSGDALPVGA